MKDYFLRVFSYDRDKVIDFLIDRNKKREKAMDEFKKDIIAAIIKYNKNTGESL